MENDFENLLFQASLLERADLYDEMVVVIKKIMTLMKDKKYDSHVQVRNLFSVGYKNIIGIKRSSYRILSSEYENQENNERKTIIENYMEMVKRELNGICDDVDVTIDTLAIGSTSFDDLESKIFFLKMKADYLRYKAEVEPTEEIVKGSEGCYVEAMKLASGIKSTNPVRLGLSLNYSVYLYEISKKGSEAIDVAKRAFDEGIAGLEELTEEHYKDSTLIMQLLRDNMTLWTTSDEKMELDESRIGEKDMDE